MKRFIQTVKNIWAIEDLRSRIATTLLLVLIYRVGSHIVLPGLDANQLQNLANNGDRGIFSLINIFAGGAFNRASVFALGIMPYISASIVVQLLTMAIPYFQKLQKEGESGRRQINQITRMLTVIVTFLQASGYVVYLRNMGADVMINPGMFWLSTTVILTAGTIFCMWMGEKITDKGIGNGTSLVISAGIIARLPHALVQEFEAKTQAAGGGLLIFLIEIALMVLIIMAIILLIQGVRRIPLNYARRIVGATSATDVTGTRDFIPLKVNSAGVMPIIFAQAIMFLPTLVSFTNIDSAQGIVRIFNDHSNVWYMLIYSVMVIGFTFLYTALIFNPKQISEDLKRNNGFVPGVKPGQPTTDYIGAVMDKITLPGAILLALVGILPGFAQKLGVTQGFSTFFGGTSLLIMVGVILDTLQQIETHLLMRQYDGLMNTGRIQGRTPITNSTI